MSRAAVAAEDQREQIALLAKLVSGCSLSIISLIQAFRRSAMQEPHC